MKSIREEGEAVDPEFVKSVHLTLLREKQG